MTQNGLHTLRMVSALKVAHCLQATPERNYIAYEDQLKYHISWYDLQCYCNACNIDWKFGVAQEEQVKKFYDKESKELTALDLACNNHYVINYYTGGLNND